MAKIGEPGFFNHMEQNGYRAGNPAELIRK
jgi:adenylylsulfate reductase subunit B